MSDAPPQAFDPELNLGEERAAPVAKDAPVLVKLKQGESGRGGYRYRFQFEKTGPAALLGHLDLVRELPRIFRRVDQRLTYTKGFHPKPDMTFAPALSLGVMSVDEYADMRLEADLDLPTLAGLVARMNAASPGGLVFRGAVKLGSADPAVTKVIAGARYGIAFARSALTEAGPGGVEAYLDARCRAAMAATSLPIRREIEGIGKVVDVRSYLLRASVAGPDTMDAIRHAGLVGDLVAIDVEVEIRGSGAVKATEIAAVIAGDGLIAPPHRAVRLELFGLADDNSRFSPLDLELSRVKRSTAAPDVAPEAGAPAVAAVAAFAAIAATVEAS